MAWCFSVARTFGSFSFPALGEIIFFWGCDCLVSPLEKLRNFDGASKFYSQNIFHIFSTEKKHALWFRKLPTLTILHKINTPLVTWPSKSFVPVKTKENKPWMLDHEDQSLEGAFIFSWNRTETGETFVHLREGTCSRTVASSTRFAKALALSKSRLILPPLTQKQQNLNSKYDGFGTKSEVFGDFGGFGRGGKQKTSGLPELGFWFIQLAQPVSFNSGIPCVVCSPPRLNLCRQAEMACKLRPAKFEVGQFLFGVWSWADQFWVPGERTNKKQGRQPTMGINHHDLC